MGKTILSFPKNKSSKVDSILITMLILSKKSIWRSIKLWFKILFKKNLKKLYWNVLFEIKPLLWLALLANLSIFLIRFH